MTKETVRSGGFHPCPRPHLVRTPMAWYCGATDPIRIWEVGDQVVYGGGKDLKSLVVWVVSGEWAQLRSIRGEDGVTTYLARLAPPMDPVFGKRPCWQVVGYTSQQVSADCFELEVT